MDNTITKLGDPCAVADRNLEFFTIQENSPTLKVTLDCTEFTCRCPITNQPDWATIIITYEPHLRIVESKSVKLYLETFRDKGVFHEYLAQVMLRDFVELLDPSRCKVTVHFNTRGGIAISATASYEKE